MVSSLANRYKWVSIRVKTIRAKGTRKKVFSNRGVWLG